MTTMTGDLDTKPLRRQGAPRPCLRRRIDGSTSNPRGDTQWAQYKIQSSPATRQT
jgi:hypothetical protein